MPEYPWSNFEDFRFVLIGETGMASVTQIYGSNQWAANIDIFGTKGILKIDLQSQSVIKYNRSTLNVKSIGVSLLSNLLQTSQVILAGGINYIARKQSDAHTIAIREFVDCILNNKTYPVNGENGKETIRVMEMLVKKLNDNCKQLTFLS